MADLANLNLLISLFIVSVACWRISHFAVYEDGPLDFMEHIRIFFGVDWAYDSNNEFSAYVPGDSVWWKKFFGGILVCVYCCSMWVALLLLALVILDVGVAILFSMPFFMSAISIMIENKVNG